MHRASVKLVAATLASAAVLSACPGHYGALLVEVNFVGGETQTRCVTVGVTGLPPVTVPRASKDQLLVALSENPDLGLTGTVSIIVQSFPDDACRGTLLTAQRQQAQFVRNQRTTVTFTFNGGGTDGGVDGGVDAGFDAGCDVATCQTRAAACQGQASCGTDGLCHFAPLDAGTSCGDRNLCDGDGGCAAQCAVRAQYEPCDDGLTCTTNEVCVAGQCGGVSYCKLADECQMARGPSAQCDLSGATCVSDPRANNASCLGSNGQCLLGVCRPFPPKISNLPTFIDQYVYPDAGWVVAPGCAAVIDTSGATPSSKDGGWCGPQAPAVTVVTIVDGGEVAVFAATSLAVGADASVHFVGARPAALLILGDATVSGLLSVASHGTSGGAGSNPGACAVTGNGAAGTQKRGGGGGALASSGGTGMGNPGDFGGGGLSVSFGNDLRGGCSGGASADVGPGAGGGALQVSVLGALTIDDGGVISASGGGGLGPEGSNKAGSGAGSGGTVFLEAARLTQTGVVTTSGGAGGCGNDPRAGDDGPELTLGPAQPAACINTGGLGGAQGVQSGGAAADAGIGSGGGGGGASVGFVFFKASGSCLRTLGSVTGVVIASDQCHP